MSCDFVSDSRYIPNLMLCYLWRSGWPQMLVIKSYHCLILIVTKIWRNILKWSYFIVSLNFDVIFTNNKQLIIVIGNVFVTPWLLYVCTFQSKLFTPIQTHIWSLLIAITHWWKWYVHCFSNSLLNKLLNNCI